MNKRYIDFVPVNNRKKPVKMVKPASVAKKPEPKMMGISVEEMFAERAEPAGVSVGGKSTKFGVIEDYHPKFVKTEVKKRPLGVKPKVATKAKPRAVSVIGGGTKTATTVAKKPGVKNGAKVAVKPPAKKTAPAGALHPNFINVNKIEKRPLSKNVYARKAPVAQASSREEPKKPTVIIARPEKDSKVGMVVAVVLTIILGAAAGTVAFLLLPK